VKLLVPVVALLLQGKVGAEIRISEVLVDGRPVEVPAERSGGDRKPFHIPSSSRALRFHFTETDDSGGPSARLRYRLEGYEEGWRDLSRAPGAKISVQFTDKEFKIVGTQDFPMQGETPGWRGSVQESDLLPCEETMVAPDRTTAARVVVYGPLTLSGMGIVVVSDVELSVSHAEMESPVVHDLRVTKGLDLDQSLGSPAMWDREGSSAGLAIIQKLDPDGPPALVISDSNPEGGALWATNRDYRIPMQAGDKVELRYKVAHSMGAAGPARENYSQLAPGRYRFRVAAARAKRFHCLLMWALPFSVVSSSGCWPVWWALWVHFGFGASSPSA